MARIAWWIALALALALAVVTLGPVSARPMTGAPPDVERGVAFALFGGAIAFACPRFRNLLISIVLAIVFAALLEAGQNFVPGRDGHIHDFIVKACGVVLGAAAVWIVRRGHGDPGG
jgi:hypothetical protein